MKHLHNLLWTILLIFAPIKATLITVMVLSMVDLIAGIKASKRRRGKRRITSAGLKRTVIKVLVYELVIVLGFLVEQYMTGDLVPVVKVLAGYIGLTELISVMENIELATGMPVVKLLTKKIEDLKRS